MTSTALTLAEYVALTTLRAVVKALQRISASGDSFRSPLLRRLVVNALGVLTECIAEIESYEPALLERERASCNPEQLPDVAAEAEGEIRQRVMKVVRSPVPPALPPIGPVEDIKPKRPHQWRNGKPAHFDVVRQCPYCDVSGRGPWMFKQHFDRCRKRPEARRA